MEKITGNVHLLLKTCVFQSRNELSSTNGDEPESLEPDRAKDLSLKVQSKELVSFSALKMLTPFKLKNLSKAQ